MNHTQTGSLNGNRYTNYLDSSGRRNFIGESTKPPPDFWPAIVNQTPLTPAQSLELLILGFYGFMRRDRPARLGGVSLLKRAGNVAALAERTAKEEVLKMLARIENGGLFIVFGHSGNGGADNACCSPCGAINAKKTHGLEDDCPLMNSIPDSVRNLASPEAEKVNAFFQARAIVRDNDCQRIITEKRLTIAYSVAFDDYIPQIHRVDNQGEAEEDSSLCRDNHLLTEACTQLQKGIAIARQEGKNLSAHYAHALIVFDPNDMRSILDSQNPEPSIGGICCIDSRWKINTPDGPRHLFRPHANEIIAVTVDSEREQSGSPIATASIIYALNHVNGIKTTKHMVVLATSAEKTQKMKKWLLEDERIRACGANEKTTSTLIFDGRNFSITADGINESISYSPAVNILQ